MLKIGQLAQRTGLTIRALHYYEEVGVLVPGKRTSTGHRLYSREDIERLQQIVALKALGFSLEEVRQCLDKESYSLQHVLERQLERVEGDLERLSAFRERLQSILRHLRNDDPVTTDMLLQIIQHTAMIDEHYTPEQHKALEARRNEIGEARMKQAGADWQSLIDAVRAEMDRGTNPRDPRVQALARRWEELVAAFTGGDPGIQQSLQKMYEEEGAEHASRGMLDTKMMAYIKTAAEAL